MALAAHASGASPLSVPAVPMAKAHQATARGVVSAHHLQELFMRLTILAILLPLATLTAPGPSQAVAPTAPEIVAAAPGLQGAAGRCGRGRRISRGPKDF